MIADFSAQRIIFLLQCFYILFNQDFIFFSASIIYENDLVRDHPFGTLCQRADTVEQHLRIILGRDDDRHQMVFPFFRLPAVLSFIPECTVRGKPHFLHGSIPFLRRMIQHLIYMSDTAFPCQTDFLTDSPVDHLITQPINCIFPDQSLFC